MRGDPPGTRTSPEATQALSCHHDKTTYVDVLRVRHCALIPRLSVYSLFQIQRPRHPCRGCCAVHEGSCRPEARGWQEGPNLATKSPAMKTPLKGARLHDARLAATGFGAPIESIKVELVGHAGSDARLLADAAFSDYQHMYGASATALAPIPNVLDLYTTAILQGAFMGSSRGASVREYLKHTGAQGTPLVRALRDAPAVSDAVDDTFGFTGWVQTHPRPGAKTKEEFVRANVSRAEGLLRKDLTEEAKGAFLTSLREAVSSAYDDDGAYSSQRRYDALLALWGIELDEPEQDAEIPELLLVPVPARPLPAPGRVSAAMELLLLDHQTLNPGTKQELILGTGGTAGSPLNHILSAVSRIAVAGAEWPGEQAKLMVSLAGGDVEDYTSRYEAIRLAAAGIPPHPRLTPHWSGFRTQLSGAVESWRKKSTADGEAAEKARDRLQGGLALLDSATAHDEKIAERVRHTFGIADQALQARPMSGDNLEVARQVLGDARSAWNLYVQNQCRKRQDRAGNETPREKAVLSVQEGLSKKLPSPASYPHDVSRAENARRRDAHARAGRQVKQVARAYAGRESCPEDVSAKLVDSLARAREFADGDEVIRRLDTVAAELGVNFTERTYETPFWVSEHASTHGRKIQPIPHTVSVARVFEVMDPLGFLVEAFEGGDAKVLHDAAEMAAILLPVVTDGGVSFDTNLFTAAQARFWALEGYADDERALRILNEALTELKSCAKLMSQSLVMERASIPTSNINKFALRGLGAGGYAYALAGEPASIAGGDLVDLEPLALGTKSAPKGLYHDRLPVLRVKTSKHQRQHFDHALGKLGRRYTTQKTELSPTMLIAERQVEIAWGPIPQVSVAGSRLFASQAIARDAQHLSESPFPEYDNRYLGVDIGEYGLAAVVIEVTDGRVEVLHSELISSAEHHALAKHVSRIRNRQKVARFGAVDSTLERIRASLIGSYRNRIDDLALRWGARVVFEDGVSAFEAGGKRFERVYASVQQSSSGGIQDVEKQRFTAAWGVRPYTNEQMDSVKAAFKLVTRTQKKRDPKNPEAPEKKNTFEVRSYRRENAGVLAHGTSQTCSKCGRWFQQQFGGRNWRSSSYEVLNGQGSYYQVRLENGLVLNASSRYATDGTVKGDRLLEDVKNFMRPSVTAPHTGIAQGDPIAERWVSGRGNSAMFHCPFADCGHVADADVQAAETIAVRGYLRDLGAEESQLKLAV